MSITIVEHNELEENMRITKHQREHIKDQIEDRFGNVIERDTLRIEQDGSVTVIADPMPNTNERGRIFCGWLKDFQ